MQVLFAVVFALSVNLLELLLFEILGVLHVECALHPDACYAAARTLSACEQFTIISKHAAHCEACTSLMHYRCSKLVNMSMVLKPGQPGQALVVLASKPGSHHVHD